MDNGPGGSANRPSGTSRQGPGLFSPVTWRVPPETHGALVERLFALNPLVGLSSGIGISIAAGLISWRTADVWTAALGMAAALFVIAVEPLRFSYWRQVRCGAVRTPVSWERRYFLRSWGCSAAMGLIAARAIIATDDVVAHMVALALCLAGVATILREYVRPWILLAELAALLGMPTLALAASGDSFYFLLSFAGAALAFNMAQIGLNLYGVALDSLLKDAELQRQNARLRESEEHYRYRVELDPRSNWTADATGHITEMSGRWSLYTGLPKAAALGRGWLAPVHPDDLPEVKAAFVRAGETGALVSVRHRYRTASGEYRWWSSSAYPRRDEDGRIIRWYGYAEDIHEQHLAELRLRESEENYRYRVELSPAFPWAVDPEGNLIEASSRLPELTGIPYEQHLGVGWLRCVHPDDVERVIALSHAAAETGIPSDMTFRYMLKDGSHRWFRARGYPRYDEDGRIVKWYGTSEDIHEQVLAEEALRQSREELQRVQAELIHVARVSAMGAMGTAIAHELNQPLAAATNYLQAGALIASEGGRVDPRLPELMGKAAEQTLRAGEIVRRLRRLVGKRDVAPETIPIAQTVEEACSLALAEARSLGIRYAVDLDPAAPVAHADRIQVQQVLINLLRNAVEAVRERPAGSIRIGSRRLADAVELSVADNGPGLPSALRDQLFTAFATTKADGLGVGLSICRTIVEAHGGRIWVEEGDGGGARFCFTLPVSQGSGEAPVGAGGMESRCESIGAVSS